MCRNAAFLASRAVILGAALAGLCAAAPARSQSPGAGTWTTKSPMPAARNEVAAAAAGGKLYVLGGSGGGRSDLTSNDEYDPATDRWRARADLPGGASHMNAVAANGRIYVAGGRGCVAHAGAVVEPARLGRARRGQWQDSCDRRARSRAGDDAPGARPRERPMERRCAADESTRPHGDHCGRWQDPCDRRPLRRGVGDDRYARSL